MPDIIGKVIGLAVPWRDRGNADLRSRGYEAFDRRAFDEQLASDANVAALIGHVRSACLANTNDDSLYLWTDESGLCASILLRDDTPGREAVRGIQAGELRGMSVNYGLRDFEWKGCHGDQTLIKVVTRAKLHEVSLVGKPAYRETIRQGLKLTLFPPGERQAPVVSYREQCQPDREETTMASGRNDLERLDRALMLSAYQMATD